MNLEFQYRLYNGPKCGGFMQRITCVPFVLMGNNINMLEAQLHKTGGYSYNDLARDAYWLIESLEQWGRDNIFMANLSKNTALNLANDLRKRTALDYLEKHGTEEVAKKDDLILAIQHFTNVLFFDLNLAESYVITQKRDRNMTILITAAEQALSAETISKLSQECLKDIHEAGKCLAFDLPTACGFHIFRALETVVLMYFPVLSITEVSEKKRNLGTYIHLLSGKDEHGQKERENALKVDPKIIGMLTHLKDFYRNPLIHPELTLEDDEAVSTYQFAVSAIDVMVHDISMWDKRLNPPQQLPECSGTAE